MTHDELRGRLFDLANKVRDLDAIGVAESRAEYLAQEVEWLAEQLTTEE